MAFSTDEKAIIKMYSGFSIDRDHLLTRLHDSLPSVDNEEIAELMESVIRKLTAMTNESVKSIDLSDALPTE